MKFYRLTRLVCAGAVALTFVRTGSADENPVESARRSLNSAGDFPWYDSRSDGLRRVEIDQTSEQDHDRNTAVGGFEDFGAVAAWLLIGVVLAVVAWRLILAMRRRPVAEDDGGAPSPETPRDHIDRVTQLPTPTPEAPGSLVEQAERLYRQGDYNQAIVYLYSHLLWRLDQTSWIRLRRGKTNRQYLAELRESGGLRNILGRAMDAFEQAFFGRRPIGRRRFEDCWRHLEQFEHLVERQPT